MATTKKSPAPKKPKLPLGVIGAHMSIAGGMHRAVERALSVDCTALQVFTKNNNQWRGKEFTDEDIANYKSAASNATIHPVVSHTSYLINMCAADKEILKKSQDAFLDELQRCEALGIPLLNFHPGAHVGKGEKEGIACIVESLNRAHDKTKGFKVKSVLETTAGQGSTIGYKFEHLREIIDAVDHPERMAVCIDTCHIFAAGYDIRTEETYEKTMQEFDDVVGLDRLAAIHINDSMKPFGSKRDRHEHIGKGEIGLIGFRSLLNDARLAAIPKILETPKEEDLKEDIMNLKTLRKLIKN